MFYKIAVTVFRLLFYILCPVKCVGRDRLPEGAAVLCPNHTHFRDPIYVAVAGTTKHTMAFMAKEELMKNKFVAFVLKHVNAFPVKRETGDISAIRAAVRALKDGKKLVIFPEGTRVHEGEEHEAKAGAAMIAAMAKAPMVPVYIHNGTKWFKRVTVEFGEPIEIVIKDKKTAAEEYKAKASEIMEKVEEMKVKYR